MSVYVIYTNNNYQKNNLELQYKNILLLRQSVLTPCEVSLSWDHSKHNSQRIIESIKALVRTWWHLKITMSFLELYPTQLNRTKIVFSSNMSYFGTFLCTILMNVSLLFYISRNWSAFMNICVARNIYFFWMTLTLLQSGCPLAGLMAGSIQFARCYSWSDTTLMFSPHEMQLCENLLPYWKFDQDERMRNVYGVCGSWEWWGEIKLPIIAQCKHNYYLRCNAGSGECSARCSHKMENICSKMRLFLLLPGTYFVFDLSNIKTTYLLVRFFWQKYSFILKKENFIV